MKNLIIVCLSIWMISTSLQPPSSFSDTLSKGKYALYNANYDSAIYYFKTCVNNANRTTEVKLLLLQTYLVKNDFATAKTIQNTIVLKTKNDSAKYFRLCGVLAFEQSDLNKATSTFASAYAINTSWNDEKCALLNDWGNVYLESNQFEKAQELYSIAYKKLRQLPKTYATQYVLIRTLINLGNIYYYKSALDSANMYYTEAAKHARHYFGSKHYLYGLAYSNIGLVQEVRGYYDDALISYEISRKIYQSIFGENHKNMAELYCSIGSTFYTMSEFELSKNYFEKELSIREKLFGSHHSSLAFLYKNLGAVNLNLKNFNVSEKQLKLSLQLNYHNFGKWHSETAESLLELSKFFLKTKQYDSCIIYAQQCKEISQQIDGKISESIGVAYIAISEALFWQHKFKESSISAKNAQDVLKQVFQTEKHPLAIEAAIWIAENELASGNLNEGLKWCQNALKNNNVDINNLSHSIKNQTYLFELELLKTLSLYGQVLYNIAQNSTDKKLFYFKRTYLVCDQSLQVSKHVLNTIYSGEGKFNLLDIQSDICATGISVSYALSLITRDEHYTSSILHFIESNKANLMKLESEKLDHYHLAKVDPKLIRKEKKLQSDINYYKNEKLLYWEAKKDDAEIQRIQERIFQLENEYQSLAKDIQRKYPAYYALKFHQNEWNISEIQQQLSKDKVILEYAIFDSILCCLFISKEKTETFLIEEDFEEDIRLLTEARIHNLDTAFYHLSRSLFTQLFSPTLQQMIKNKTLVIIPESYLNKLPFELLIQDQLHPTEPNNWNYLIRTNPIIYNTSIYFFLKKYAYKTGSGIALVSIPQKKEDLPYAIKEVQEISKLFDEQDCLVTSEEQLFKKKSSNYACLHFATHAFLNDTIPNYSYLVLDSNNNEDGRLYTHEIYGLNLHARLVSLSACETGLGKNIAGEGNLSLARAFTYAGCPNIISSTWKLPDAASYKIMTAFYRNLTMGMTKEKALQSAKVSFIDSHMRFEEAPVYWAGLRLQGNQEPLCFGQDRHYKFWLLGILLSAFIFIGYFQLKTKNLPKPL